MATPRRSCGQRRWVHPAGREQAAHVCRCNEAATSTARKAEAMTLSVVVRGGTVFDGEGGPGVAADVGIEGDRVVVVGSVPADADALEIDATGLAVVPGFINTLSHAWGALQRDGSGVSDLVQGVTTEVFGEAFTPGPSTPEFTVAVGSMYADVNVDFRRLSDGLSDLESRGIALNVA